MASQSSSAERASCHSTGSEASSSQRTQHVPSLVSLSKAAVIAHLKTIDDFTMIPEHLVADMFVVRDQALCSSAVVHATGHVRTQ